MNHKVRKQFYEKPEDCSIVKSTETNVHKEEMG